MSSAHFVLPDGTTRTLDVDTGASLMRAATAVGLPGLVGECGGIMAWATCHAFVDPAYIAKLTTASASEQQMLEFTAAPMQDNSRLACQIEMNDAPDGIVVTVADPQL